LLVGFLVLLLVVELFVVPDGSVPLRLLPATGTTAIDIHSNPPRHRKAMAEGKYGELFALIFSL
jgi:hypothetical protein